MSNKIIVPEGRVLVQALPNDKEGIYTIQCPINLLDESKWLIADKVGERVYNPRPIAGTSFVKAWYEVQDVADHTLTPDPEPDYEWVKVVEGGSVDIDEETIVKDDTTDALKVNLDNESLKYDSTDDNIKVNIDNESLKYNDTDDCVEVNIDKQTIVKDDTTDELKISGIIPAGTDHTIEFAKSDDKWGYKPDEGTIIPFAPTPVKQSVWDTWTDAQKAAGWFVITED